MTCPVAVAYNSHNTYLCRKCKQYHYCHHEYQFVEPTAERIRVLCKCVKCDKEHYKIDACSTGNHLIAERNA